MTTRYFAGQGTIVHGELRIPVRYHFDVLFGGPVFRDEWFGMITEADPVAMFPLVSADAVELVTEDGRVGRILVQKRNSDGSWSFQGTGPFPARVSHKS